MLHLQRRHRPETTETFPLTKQTEMTNTLTPTYEDLAPMILSGDGYELTIAPEAEARKMALLKKSGHVLTVTSNDESADAQHVTRSLAAMRIEVEKCRKLVVEPVNRITKIINSTAADFVAEIAAEENRIKQLVGNHANEVLRIKAAKESEERVAFEAARQAREAAELAAIAAEDSGKIADVIAAKQAEAARLDALAERMEASADVAGTKIAEGVRFAWDFEVIHIESVFRGAPELVNMDIKRAAVLAWFRDLESADTDVAAAACQIGIRAFKKPVVSSR